MINKFNSWIGELGLINAVKRLQKTLKIPIRIIVLPKETLKLLTNGAGLLLSNHDSDAEPAAIVASLPDRKDLYLVGSHRLPEKIPNLAQYILPVNVDHLRKLSNKKSLTTIVGRLRRSPKNIRGIMKGNLKSIREAAIKVNDGGMVIIFPQGVHTEDKWQSGVNWITKKITNPDAKIVFAYVANTSHWDYLRFFPILRRFLPDIKVYFSEPMEIDSEKSAEALRSDFYEWVSTLKN